MGRNCIVRGISRFSLPNCLKRHFVQCIQKQHSHIHFKKMLKQWCYKKNSDCSTKQLSGNWTQREGEKDKEWAREQGRTKTLMPAIVRTYGPDNTWNILKHYINRLAAIPTIPPKKSARVSWKRGAEIHWDPLSSELHTEPRSFLHWPLEKAESFQWNSAKHCFSQHSDGIFALGYKKRCCLSESFYGIWRKPMVFLPIVHAEVSCKLDSYCPTNSCKCYWIGAGAEKKMWYITPARPRRGHCWSVTGSQKFQLVP
jgi:hypothetical protein